MQSDSVDLKYRKLTTIEARSDAAGHMFAGDRLVLHVNEVGEDALLPWHTLSRSKCE
jgi:hypothetical protein